MIKSRDKFDLHWKYLSVCTGREPIDSLFCSRFIYVQWDSIQVLCFMCCDAGTNRWRDNGYHIWLVFSVSITTSLRMYNRLIINVSSWINHRSLKGPFPDRMIRGPIRHDPGRSVAIHGNPIHGIFISWNVLNMFNTFSSPTTDKKPREDPYQSVDDP